MFGYSMGAVAKSLMGVGRAAGAGAHGRIAQGAILGAGAGAAYGAISDRQSVLGGAMSGGLMGAAAGGAYSAGRGGYNVFNNPGWKGTKAGWKGVGIGAKNAGVTDFKKLLGLGKASKEAIGSSRAMNPIKGIRKSKVSGTRGQVNNFLQGIPRSKTGTLDNRRGASASTRRKMKKPSR